MKRGLSTSWYSDHLEEEEEEEKEEGEGIEEEEEQEETLPRKISESTMGICAEKLGHSWSCHPLSLAMCQHST